MNAPERVSTVPGQEKVTDTSSRPKEEKMPANQPARARRERRFEIGFFIRKIVNGWVVFYKQFPREQRAAVLAQVTNRVQQTGSPAEQGDPRMRAVQRSASGDVTGGGVTIQSGTGGGPGEGGPIGGTRVEAGFFVATITETSGDEESEDD